MKRTRSTIKKSESKPTKPQTSLVSQAVSKKSNGTISRNSKELLVRKRDDSESEKEEEDDDKEDDDDDDFANVEIDINSDEEDSEQSEGEDEEEEEGDSVPFPEDSDEDEDNDNDVENGHVNNDEEDEDNDSVDGNEDPDIEEDYLSSDSLDESDVKYTRNQENTQKGGYIRKKHPEIEANYDSDSSTEETTNTVGNIPMHWYDDYPHIGYDVDGKRILRPATADELDKFLGTVEDPDTWRSAKSTKDGKDIVLNDDELDIIRRLQDGMIPDKDYDPYEPTIEWFTSKTEIMPLSAAPEPKRRFVPSKWEAKKVMKIVRAIREGRIVPHKPKTSDKPRFYGLWNDDDIPKPDHVMHLPAPKIKLPENDESYNPPAEYLPTDEERKEWESTDKEDRPKNYLPKKYSNLRTVPAYNSFIQERFERCLDLYLAPRVRKNRLNIDPESLIPKLPSPKDLQPFPTSEAFVYSGHTSRVRSFSIDPTGLFLASGSDDKTIRLWEISTSRCLYTWQVDDIVYAVSWNPNRDIWCFAAAIGDKVALISPSGNLVSAERQDFTDQYITAGFALSKGESENSTSKLIEWIKPTTTKEIETGYKLHLKHKLTVKQITWHRKGDYFATVTPDASNSPVLIHQLTKHQSQSPLKKPKGAVQRVLFHPVKPSFFVATQRYVRVYNLIKQELTKTLQSGVKWISSMDVHPGGDNVIIGSYDKRLCWFDLDLSSKPYKTMRYHNQAIRSVAFHHRYPLFASCSDDGSIQIFHGMVYNDLLQNPLIVPVKILRGHQVVNSLGVLNIEFHPTQPWIISAGADSSIRLWT